MEELREAWAVLRRHWKELLLAVLGPGFWMLLHVMLSGADPSTWLSGWRHIILTVAGLLSFAFMLWVFLRGAGKRI